MRRLLVVSFVIVAVAGAFSLGRRLPSTRGNPPEIADIGPSSQGVALDIDSVRLARRETRRRIADSDSYISHSIRSGDSVLKRWPVRQRPLPVFLEPRGGGLPQAVRDAFNRWERVGAIPVQFAFVDDSSAAEVHVRWIRFFDIRRTGQADVVWDDQGWLRRAALTLATETESGRPLPDNVVYTVALHEIGHLLGLGHSDDPDDVMYPATTVHDLTARDRRTARLLYALPPGSIRDP